MASYLRKYATGTGADIYINIPKAGSPNHAVGADWTPAAGDVKVSIDGGVAANIGTLPTAVAMGNSAIWKFVFTDGELTGAIISITVADSATKAVDDTGFSIETYGNASALHAFDLDTATVVASSVGTGGISAGSFAAGAIDAAAIAANAIGSSELAADAIGASELAADAVTEIVTGVFARAFSAAYGSYTFDQVMSILLAVSAAKLSGAATTTVTIRNIADGADVIVATVDADGNRTAVTITP